MHCQLLLLSTLAATSIAYDDGFHHRRQASSGIDDNGGFSNPVEPSTPLADGPSSTAPPGIVVTITGVSGEEFTTTFAPSPNDGTSLPETTPETGSQVNSVTTSVLVVPTTLSAVQTTVGASTDTTDANEVVTTDTDQFDTAETTAEATATDTETSTSTRARVTRTSNLAAMPSAFVDHAAAGVAAALGFVVFL